VIGFANDQWHRAATTLQTARRLADDDPDSAASRAFYAAFYAVTALFSAEGRDFKKHSALRAAVHRDLVKAGRWPSELGVAYDFLMEMREIGDYGGVARVTVDDARKAVDLAKKILDAVAPAFQTETE
jgi:uncharacterized protein (UPF0332 family)